MEGPCLSRISGPLLLDKKLAIHLINSSSRGPNWSPSFESLLRELTLSIRLKSYICFRVVDLWSLNNTHTQWSLLWWVQTPSCHSSKTLILAKIYLILLEVIRTRSHIRLLGWWRTRLCKTLIRFYVWWLFGAATRRHKVIGFNHRWFTSFLHRIGLAVFWWNLRCYSVVRSLNDTAVFNGSSWATSLRHYGSLVLLVFYRTFW